MANNKDGPEITMYASTDLSDYQFHVVTVDTSGYAKLADDPDDPVEPMLGILQNKPENAGEPAVVRITGVAKAMGGASIDEGVAVTCDGDGHIAAATTNDWVLGVSLTAFVSGSLGEVLLQTGGSGGYSAPS